MSSADSPDRSWPPIPKLNPTLWLGLAALIGVVTGMVAGKSSAPLTLVALGVGGAGAAVILVSPKTGLLAIAFVTYLSLSDVLIDEYGAPSIAKLLIPLVVAAVLVRWARTGEQPPTWFPPVLLVSIYGIASALSLFVASDVGVATERLSELAKDGLVFILVVTILQDGVTLRRVVWALLAAVICMATIGVHQQLTGNFESSYWGFAKPPSQFSLDGVSTPRLAGPVGDPNFFGMILLVIVPLAIDRLFSERRRLLKVAAGWALVVSGLAIVFTYSRSALLSLIALLAVLALVRRPRPRHLAVAAVATLLLLPLLPTSYSQRLSELAESVTELTESGTTSEISVRGRLSENLVAVEMFLDHPLIGVGYGNYPTHYLEYSREVGLDPRNQNRAPHNLYLEVLSETGIVGFAALALVLGVALASGLRARRLLLQANKTRLARLVEACTLTLVGYLIASLFLHASHPRYLWLLTGTVLALAQVARHEIESEPSASAANL